MITTEKMQKSRLELRDYQKVVVQAALERNTLAVLPTGSGKTLIATHIIANRLKMIHQRSFADISKRLIVFLAPTKILVGQQHRYLSSHLNIENVKILSFTGETTFIDGKSLQYLNQNGWTEQLKEIDILVMTPQIFKQMLQKKHFLIDFFDCVVIDECHHASGDHPLTYICEAINCFVEPPLVFAMTASPVMCKKASISESLATLEKTLGCRTLRTKEILDQYKSLIPKAELSLFRFKEDRGDIVDSCTNGSPIITFKKNLIHFRTDFTQLMLISFQRARFASLVNTLYTLLINIRSDPDELGINDKNYPSVTTFKNYRKSGVLDANAAFQFQPIKHIFKYNARIKFGSGVEKGIQLVQSFGQILKICEDSGMIAGLYAFLVCIGNTKRTMADDAPNFSQACLQKNEIGFRGRYNRNNNDSKRSRQFFHKVKLSSTGGISDMDRVNSIVKVLSTSPFQIIDLVHENYCYCATLIDFMVCFASSLGPAVCFHAQKKFLQLQKRLAPSTFTCSIRINTPVTKEIALVDGCINLFIPHAIIYILLQCIIEEKPLNQFNSEGCLNLVAEYWNEYVEVSEETVHLSNFELREKDCYSTILCVGWCLLCNISVEELSNWSSALEFDETSSLEPMKIEGGNVCTSLEIFTCSEEDQSFVPVSSKLQALCQVWLQLNSSSDSVVADCGTGGDSALTTDSNSTTSSEESFVEQKEDADIAQIIFCRMRLNAMALQFVMSMIIENLTNLPEEPTDDNEILLLEVQNLMTDLLDTVCGERRSKIKWSCRELSIRSPKFRSAHMVGGSSQDRQLEVLKLFKTGLFNIVFATDVMEEGLDVKACKYIINFDLPSCVKSFVQRKGRSRSDNSKMIFLVPYGKEGLRILKELEELRFQEKEIEKYTNDPQIESIASVDNIFEQTTVYCETEYSMIETTNNLLQFDGSSDLLADFITSSISKDEELHRLYNIGTHTDHYKVDSTGAEVDGKTATQLLQRFCQQLHHDRFYKPQPVFWITKRLEFSNIQYCCAILLPPHVEPPIRFIVGPCVSSKASAKSYASLECIKLLHKNGHLNDYLTIIGGRRKRSIEEIDSLSRGSSAKRRKLTLKLGDGGELRSKDTEEVDQLIENMNAKDDFKVNSENKELIQISSKYIPDALCILPSGDPEDQITPLYLYVVQSNFSDHRSEEIIMNCKSCRYYFQGLNSFGIALTAYVPDEVLLETFSGFVRDNEEVEISIRFLDFRQVTKSELIQMQRFHKALICWEPENTSLGDEGDGYNWINMDDSVRDHLWPVHGPHYPIADEEWISSGNGAYYLVYPLPDNLPLSKSSPSPVEKADEVIEFLKTSQIYNERARWIDHLLRCADESQILAHNLLVQYKINQGRNRCYFTPYHEWDAKDIEGMLLSRGVGSLYVCCSCKNEKKLNDIAKFVPKEQPSAKLVVSSLLSDVITSVEASSPKEAKVTATVLYDALKEPSSQISDKDVVHKKVASKVDSDMTPITFLQICMKRHPKYIVKLAALAQKPNYHLISVVGIAGKLTLICLLKNPFAGLNEGMALQQIRRKAHSHATPIYIIPELSQAIGKCKWYAVGLVFPSVAWRLKSLLLAFEVRGRILQSILAYDRRSVKNNKNEYEITDSHESANAKFTDALKMTQQEKLNLPFSFPNLSIMLEAITPRCITELIDSERLEMLGDSLLKLVTSVEVYRLFPRKHEGFLTFERAKFISNIFLLERSCKLGLHHYLRAISISTGKQQLITMPPGIDLTKYKEGFSLWNRSLNQGKSDVDEEAFSSLIPSFEDIYPVKQHKYVEVKPKILADLMEAIFGAFYVSGGLAAGIAVIKAFGVWPTVKKRGKHQQKSAEKMVTEESEKMNSEDVQHSLVPSGDILEEDLQDSSNYQFEKIDLTNFMEEYEFPDNYPEVLKRIVRGMKQNVFDLQREESETIVIEEETSDLCDLTLDVNYTEIISSAKTAFTSSSRLTKIFGILQLKEDQVIHELEIIFNYRFKSLKILEEALTHCSCQEMISNQRLEFLGDAVLDFAVVSLLYQQLPNATPGDLSSMKSKLTCNRHLGLLGIKMGIYKYLKFSSSRLETDFEELFQSDASQSTSHQSHSVEEQCVTVLPEPMTIDTDDAVVDDIDDMVEVIPQIDEVKKFSLMNSVQVEDENDIEIEELMRACISEMVTYIEDTEKLSQSNIKKDNVQTNTTERKSVRINYSTSKVVADMFEALIGAIFLDSGCCFDVIINLVQHINLLSSLSSEELEPRFISFIDDDTAVAAEVKIISTADSFVGKKRSREQFRSTKHAKLQYKEQLEIVQASSVAASILSDPVIDSFLPAKAEVTNVEVEPETVDSIIGMKRKISFDDKL